MENETNSKVVEGHSLSEQNKKNYTVPLSIIISAVVLAGAIYIAGYNNGRNLQQNGNNKITLSNAQSSLLEDVVLPSKGMEIPIQWKNLGMKLVESGAIDADKFKAMYEQRGAFTDEYKILLLGQSKGNLKITRENAGYLLNLFWALGLANKNPILDSGEIVDKVYGGAGNFASTGGWTMAKGNPMDHYSQHEFLVLTSDQQMLVDKVSKGIYRPCCNNSTHFPDCNHGMAMLGLLELMASQGASEQAMWDTALTVNSYWFPDTYVTIATYMKSKGVEWKDVKPQELLGFDYSSASGYAKISSQVIKPQQTQSGNGCGVDTGTPVVAPKQQSGCGV